MQTAALVLTTINDPSLLADYYDNFHAHGHVDNVRVIVIPDKKTPEAVYRRCRELSDKGLRTSCPNIEEQEQFMARLGLPASVIPYNSDNRRNIGYLMAYESGCDFLISIDDDNYCQEGDDYFSEHAIVCKDSVVQPVADSATGYLNICNLLTFEMPAPVYARGFPYYARHRAEDVRTADTRVPVHINAGLWTLDPDIDAITWLVAKPRVTGFPGRSIVLGRDTWSPVNTQNTALRRETIPSYYFTRMGYAMSGMPIDRYGDIFSGYFAQACTRHLGGYIRVGTPVAAHKRNSHSYIKDATNEWSCILVLEDLLPWLRETHLCGDTYTETYASLSHRMQDAVETFKGNIWTDVTRAYFHQVAYYMRRWIKACIEIDGK